VTNLESVCTLLSCFVVGFRLGWWARSKLDDRASTRPTVATHIRALEPPEVIELHRRRGAPRT
jgi:hypothetical protein